MPFVNPTPGITNKMSESLKNSIKYLSTHMVCMISRIYYPSPNAWPGKKQLHETWVSPFQQRTNASISAVADDDVSFLFLSADTCQSQSAIQKQYLLLIIQLPVNHLRLGFSCDSRRTSSRIWALQPPCVLTPKSLQQTPTTSALLGRSAIPVSNCWQRSLCSPPFRQVNLACHSVF